MNCGRVSNQLSAYIDRELTGMEMLQIRSHLSDCDRCRAEYEALSRMKMMLGRLPSIEPPQELVTKTVRRFELTGSLPFLTGQQREPRQRLLAAARRLSRARAAGGLSWPGVCPRVFDTPGGARRVLGSISRQRVAISLTTVVLAAALIFTNIVLHRHSDTLVATTPSLVLEGRQDQLETPQFVDGAPGELTMPYGFRDRLPDGQASLPWVNVSLQGENSWTFR
jgi:anti-sigma factor RsiW